MKMNKLGCLLKIGSMFEGFVEIITLGNGKHIAYYIATKLGYESCGCEERKEWMNGWTCKEIREYRKQIKLWQTKD